MSSLSRSVKQRCCFVRSPEHETRGRAVHPPQNRTGPTRTDALKLVEMIVGEDSFEESLF